jgi:hypothetical protein
MALLEELAEDGHRGRMLVEDEGPDRRDDEHWPNTASMWSEG